MPLPLSFSSLVAVFSSTEGRIYPDCNRTATVYHKGLGPQTSPEVHQSAAAEDDVMSIADAANKNADWLVRASLPWCTGQHLLVVWNFALLPQFRSAERRTDEQAGRPVESWCRREGTGPNLGFGGSCVAAVEAESRQEGKTVAANSPESAAAKSFLL